MDGSRFDLIARSLAGGASRRGFLGGVAALAAGLAGVRTADAACGPDQVSRRGLCLCKTTGRPPGADGRCPCASGLTRCGEACVNTGRDAAHCGGCDLACAANEQCRSGACVCPPDCAGKTCGEDDGCGGSCIVQDCPPTQTCLAGACRCEAPRVPLANGSCGYPCTTHEECVTLCSGGCLSELPGAGDLYCIKAFDFGTCSGGTTDCPTGTWCFGISCDSLC